MHGADVLGAHRWGEWGSCLEGLLRKGKALKGLGRGAAGAEGRERMPCTQAVAVADVLGVHRVREGRRLQKTILECDKGLPSLCLSAP